MAALRIEPTSAAQTIPYKLNFQGRLTNSAGNTMPDGLYNMQFRLYDAASGGTLLWSETRETTSRVSVTNGLFSTQLGDVTSLPPSLFNSATPRYFEITLATPATATCSTAACATWESPMTPRQALGAAAYAMNADTLDGIDGDSYARRDADNTFSGYQVFRNTTDSTGAFSIQNAGGTAMFTADTSATRVNIGSSTTDATAVLLVADSYNSATDPTGVNGGMYYNSNLGKFRCYEAGTWKDCIAAGGGGGTLQGAYDASGSPATVATSSATKHVIFKSGAGFNTSGFFQLQDAGGTAFLSADSSTRTVTITNLSVSRIITSGGTPSVTSPSCGTVTVSGNDVAGEITFVGNGSGCPGALTAFTTLTFNTAYGAAPRVIIRPGNDNAAYDTSSVYATNITTTKFEVFFTNALAGSTNTYKWTYIVVQ